MWLIYMHKELIQKKTTGIPKAINQQTKTTQQFKPGGDFPGGPVIRTLCFH